MYKRKKNTLHVILKSLTSDLNCILKGNRLSLYKVDDDGLKPALRGGHVEMYLWHQLHWEMKRDVSEFWENYVQWINLNNINSVK